jgi:hypothetical protein
LARRNLACLSIDFAVMRGGESPEDHAVTKK